MAASPEPKKQKRKTLDARSIGKLKPEAEPYDVPDGDVSGLSLRIMPTGRRTYYLRYTVGGHRQRIKIGDGDALTLTQARDEARKTLGSALQGNDPVAAKKRRKKQVTLKKFLEDTYGPWYKRHRKTGEKTVASLEAAFVGLLDKRLDELTARDLERWREQKKVEGLRPSTTNRYLANLRALFTKAVDWEYLKEHPMRRVKQEREDNSRVRFLSAEEEKALFEALDTREERIREERDKYNKWLDKRKMNLYPDLRKFAFADYLRPMVILSLDTGMRRGEIFSLEWTDVQLGPTPQVTVKGDTSKSGKTRHIPLTTRAAQTLTAWREQCDNNALVFPSPVTGKRLDNTYSSWDEVCTCAGLADFKWHDLRHTFASKLMMRGSNLYDVKNLMGHQTITMTERYAHLGAQHLRDAVAALDRQ